MKATGETTESVLLRQLVDEALAARKKKTESLPLIDEPDNEFRGRLQRVENLPMRLVQQGDVAFRIQDVCLALLQAVLAEAYAAHKLSWEFGAAPRLRDEGVDTNELKQRFLRQADQARDYAYRQAERIKRSQEVTRSVFLSALLPLVPFGLLAGVVGATSGSVSRVSFF